MVLETLEMILVFLLICTLNWGIGNQRSLFLRSHAPSVFNRKEQIGLKSIKNPL
jgi:hypothetical protein